MDLPGASFLIGFSAVLGLNQSLVKIVNEGIAPIFQTGLRSACAFALILGYVWLRRIRLDLSVGVLWLGLLTGTLFALEFGFLFSALEFTTVSRVSLLFYTMPFMVAVGAHFLFPQEQLTALRLAGLALAIGGIALVMLGGESGKTATTWIGDALCLLAAFAWASLTLITRATRLAQCPPEQNLLYQLAVSGALMIALAPLFGDLVREPTPMILGIFAFQVVAVASIGFLIWLWVLSIYPVSNMASFSLLAPLFGVFFGWLIFDDPLSVRFAAALTLVCVGLLLINRKPKSNMKKNV